MKKTIAIITLIAMLLGCMSFSVAAEEAGTYENPLAASDFYGMYLMNNELEAGDSDGVWYSFKASSAGIISVENSVQDQDGNKIYNYQLAVEVNGNTFYANDAVFSNPVTTFRVTRGTVVKVGMWMTPDEEGNIPYGKMYVSASIVSGIESDPVKVKSPGGFAAAVGAGKTVNYLDGSSAGVYTGKGVVVEGDADVIAATTVMYGSAQYTDTDGDGKIEFSFPAGVAGSMIATHYAFSIINESSSDEVYTFRLTDSAKEGNFEPVTGHAVNHISRVEPTCTESGMEEYWFCSECNKAYEDEAYTVITNLDALVLPAKGHDFADGICTVCGEPDATVILGDIDNSQSVDGKDALLLKILLSGSTIPSESEKVAGDVNGDGDLNGKDSNLLSQFIAGAIGEF